jgi:hypothetical protein
LIFPAKQAAAIARGAKTTHRTPPSTVWRPGRTIAVQATVGAEPVCHVRVLSVTEATLNDLTRQEATREGFDGARGPLNFKRAWIEGQDGAWIRRQAATDLGVTDEEVACRFADRWRWAPILVVTLELAEAPSLYLADVRAGGGDYTTSSRRAIDELACPSAADAERARAEGERQRASFRADLEAARAERKAARGRAFRDAA